MSDYGRNKHEGTNTTPQRIVSGLDMNDMGIDVLSGPQYAENSITIMTPEEPSISLFILVTVLGGERIFVSWVYA